MENPGNRPEQGAWRFGLIGHPLGGSGSPALFAKAYGGRWPYDLIEGSDFEASWQKFLDEYRAINITAPFKELAFRRVQETGRVDDSCLEIGAINIAVKTPEGIVGYNSDFLGVRKVLLDEGFGDTEVLPTSRKSEGWNQKGPKMLPTSQKSRGWEHFLDGQERSDNRSTASAGYIRGGAPNNAAEGRPDQRLALVVGFGGAGKAAAAAAKSIGMDVIVCNRTRRTPDIRPLEDLPVLIPVAGIIIYCLSSPIPEIETLLNESPANLPGCVILEANYRTPCLENFGGRYIHGRRWLEAQAATGYPLMTGVELYNLMVYRAARQSNQASGPVMSALLQQEPKQ